MRTSMKIWSNRKSALKNMDQYDGETTEGLYCTGGYKTTIETMDVNPDVLALYKQYRSDQDGPYVKVYGIYKKGEQ